MIVNSLFQATLLAMFQTRIQATLLISCLEQARTFLVYMFACAWIRNTQPLTQITNDISFFQKSATDRNFRATNGFIYRVLIH